MAVNEIFEGVFKVDGKLATKNMVKGRKVYDEDLVYEKGVEYRLWNPYRSKLGAAILKGLKNMKIKHNASILYLGSATGTTSSHVSDIVGENGIVYCVEISERSMRDFLKVCEVRDNLLPILQDARNVEAYAGDVGQVDFIYQDVAARDQADILIRNSDLLKGNGLAYVAIKSQSISISKPPSQVYNEFLNTVRKRFNVLESIKMDPYDKMHLFVVLQKR